MRLKFGASAALRLNNKQDFQHLTITSFIFDGHYITEEHDQKVIKERAERRILFRERQIFQEIS